MSLDLIAKHKGNSDIADGMLEIIRQLGLWLEAITGVNPDAGYSSFSAANYNHGNRSEQADLIEEVILRLQEINDAGPSGGGSSVDNKIRVDSSDTFSKTFDQLIDPLLNEISWGKSDGTPELGKQIVLIAKLAYLAGQKCFVGSDLDVSIEKAKLNVLSDEGEPIAVFVTVDNNNRLRITSKAFLKYESAETDPTSDIFALSTNGAAIQLLLDPPSGDTRHLTVQYDGLLTDAIKHTSHSSYAAVLADSAIAAGEIVALDSGVLVHKPV